jgi:type IV pilus biogenesis protein PilP
LLSRFKAVLVTLTVSSAILGMAPVAALAPETAPRPETRPTSPDLPPGFVSDRPTPRPDALEERALAILERERRARLRAQSAASTSNTRINAAATQRDALQMTEVSLIAVFGTEENRRALLRMRDGSFVRVSRGAMVDGWRVIAVGADQVRLLRGGETQLLALP